MKRLWLKIIQIKAYDSGANFIGADFAHVKTGISPLNTILIFMQH